MGIIVVLVMVLYNVSKVVIVSFFEIMWLELIDVRIGVSVLCLGFFKINFDELVCSVNLVMKGVVI